MANVKAVAGSRSREPQQPLTFPIILIRSMNIDRKALLTGWDAMLQRVGRRCLSGGAGVDRAMQTQPDVLSSPWGEACASPQTPHTTGPALPAQSPCARGSRPFAALVLRAPTTPARLSRRRTARSARRGRARPRL